MTSKKIYFTNFLIELFPQDFLPRAENTGRTYLFFNEYFIQTFLMIRFQLIISMAINLETLLCPSTCNLQLRVRMISIFGTKYIVRLFFMNKKISQYLFVKFFFLFVAKSKIHLQLNISKYQTTL